LTGWHPRLYLVGGFCFRFSHGAVIDAMAIEIGYRQFVICY
jgi:hypothetical protein